MRLAYLSRAYAEVKFVRRRFPAWRRLAQFQTQPGHQKAARQLTLVPLPSLQPVNVITVNNDRLHLVVVDLFQRTTCLHTECFLGVAEDEVDLASNGFSSLGMITLNRAALVTARRSLVRISYSPVTIMTLIPARRRVPMASLTPCFGGSSSEVSETKQYSALG